MSRAKSNVESVLVVAQPDEADAPTPKPESIEELFGALESPLLIYAQRLAGDAGAAEDLVQEAFVRLHAQFEQVRAPRRWLYRTIHNLALNYRRDSSKVVPLQPAGGEGEEMDPPDALPLPDEQIARWEAIGLVRLSLAELDERSRELIRLKFNEGLSYQEMSARTGLSSSNVGYLLHHALKTIAAGLAKSGVLP